jgi:hypothetical protein
MLQVANDIVHMFIETHPSYNLKPSKTYTQNYMHTIHARMKHTLKVTY